jgi:hypothetical protein
MANGYWNKQVAPLKKSSGAGPKLSRGAAAPTGKTTDTVRSLPDVSPHWKGSFNSGVKYPVVKTHLVKKGVD